MKTNRSIKARFLILLVIPLFSLLSCGRDKSSQNDSGHSKKNKNIVLKGSDTVLPLGQKEAEMYMKKDAGASVSVTGGGSGVGITSLMNGTTDIAMISRDLKIEEKLKFFDKNKSIELVTIAYDGLALIVNPENQINQLTREQLEKIFTGEITNWKDVGGANEKIVAYSRESSSGTFEFFKEAVMSKKNYAATVLSVPATGAIVQSVSQTKGAIGYIGMAYETSGVKSLSVSYDSGKTFVAPSVAAAKDKTYPISRALFYIYDKANTVKVQPFIDYATSEEGQKIVASIGYVPLK